jgi:hypothetical protein
VHPSPRHQGLCGPAYIKRHRPSRHWLPAILFAQFGNFAIERQLSFAVAAKLLHEGSFTDFDRNGIESMFERADVICLVQIPRDMEPKSPA